MKKVILAVAAMGLMSGCAGFAFSGKPVGNGSLYAGTRTNEMVTQNKLGSKTGEACAMSILGIVTLGDSAAQTAAKSAGISSISSVDNEFTNILGLYAKYCVRVSGD